MQRMRTASTLDELRGLRHGWRADGLSLVVTNGVFDLLHLGHARYLDDARSLGDILVIGLNSDSSTRRIKGPRRPLVPERERAELLLSLRAVDYVVMFGEPTAEALVAALEPDIYCKGADYALRPGDGKQLPEAPIVQRYGGRVELIPYLAGHSTSELIDTIVERYGS